MGMDVFGKRPKSDRGAYFRNNVWWWRPLWNYCLRVAPELCEPVAGHYNAGEGLNTKGALALARILRDEMESGRTAEYEREYNEWRANLPRLECSICESTGIRRDEVGVEMGMPERELSPEVQILTGRTHGSCNACDGVGTREHFDAYYPFSVDNVREFTEFLEDCGGFSIC